MGIFNIFGGKPDGTGKSEDARKQRKGTEGKRSRRDDERRRESTRFLDAWMYEEDDDDLPFIFED